MKSKAKFEMNDVTKAELQSIVDAIELSQHTKVKFQRFGETGVILVVKGQRQDIIYNVTDAPGAKLAKYEGVNPDGYIHRDSSLSAHINYHGDAGNH